MYDRFNSAQADSVIHREVAAASGMTPRAKELAVVLFDNILAKSIQIASRFDGRVSFGSQDLIQAASQAIFEAKKEFPVAA
jgi:hypothetical protein